MHATRISGFGSQIRGIFVLMILGMFFVQCPATTYTSFSDGDLVFEKKVKEELQAIALARCIETGGDNLKLLEAYIFVDKLFTKSSGSKSQRDRITYSKKEAERCRNNLLIFPVENCDFKPFDLWNYVTSYGLCKLEPTSFFQF